MSFRDRINDETVATICKVLERTRSLKMAAAQAGVSIRAVNHWLSLGAQCKGGSKSRYKVFLDRCNAARAACDIPIANAVRTAAKGGFEMRPKHKSYVDNFGRRHELDELETNENGQPIMILCEVKADAKAAMWWLERAEPETYGPPEQKVAVRDVPLEENPIAIEVVTRIERLRYDAGKRFKTAGGELRQLPAPDITDAEVVKSDPDDVSDKF